MVPGNEPGRTTLVSMDAIETLRLDAQAGRISADRLIDLIASQQPLLQSTQQQLQAAQIRIEELEKQVGGSATAKVEEPFSLRAEEPRQAARGKQRKRRPKGRRGRLKSKDKIALAKRTEAVFPDGVAPELC